MTKNQFKIEVEKIFYNFSPRFFDQIEIYKEFLQEYNKTVNLTRLDSDDKIYKNYFFESIVCYRKIDFSKIKYLLDIGSGSGIPGIVIKILFPEINLQIIESNGKKIEFLNQLIKKLDITGVTLINKRAEELDSSEYEQFDLVTSRAVAQLQHILEISIPYAKVGSLIVEPKSNNVQSEMINIDYFLNKMGSKIEKIDSFTSVNDIKHEVVYVRKTEITDRFFPRKWSKIINEPL